MTEVANHLENGTNGHHNGHHRETEEERKVRKERERKDRENETEEERRIRKVKNVILNCAHLVATKCIQDFQSLQLATQKLFSHFIGEGKKITCK